eukprot:1339969-Ditylum_brightwellii.AAC.1
MPDFLRREIEALAEESRTTGDTVQHNADASTNNLTDDTSGWLDADEDIMVNNSIGDEEEVHIQWTGIMIGLNLNMSMMRSFWQHVDPVTSKYVRWQWFRNQLNQNQCMIHDLVVRSSFLPTGQSSTDGGSDVGRLHILLGQCSG